MIKSISIETEEGTYAGDMVFTPNLPPPPPPSVDRKYVFLNVPNWLPIDNLPLQYASEFSYFVLPVSASGMLMGTSDAAERFFVSKVIAAGKKPTFTVGGGTQSASDITAAITLNKNAFINNITEHLTRYNFSGVCIDIENISIAPQSIVDFIKLLRIKFDSVKIGLKIGIYSQPYSKDTIWLKIQDAVDSFDFLSVMVYDFPNTVADLRRITLDWLPRVAGRRDKLLVGAAVNYNTTGLNEMEFGEVLDWISDQGLKGIAIWNSSLFTQTYREILKNKFLSVE